MIPPNQGFNLFQDSSLNKTPRENFYISIYEGPNGISKDVPDRAQTLLFVVKVSDLDDETVTCGIPYNLAILNSPERSHLGKNLIPPKW